ncbi:hypothetical protein HaLaN_25109 [Haematococcus lacustris]|uniref:Uncharacterized protein n=1 Tax=Haematococcus lacustris TaxID=44745 RepID=A0A6A0A394_HAELA|nr:hypothetical protein HaLaN_25109 [Haematococcus lacustris]
MAFTQPCHACPGAETCAIGVAPIPVNEKVRPPISRTPTQHRAAQVHCTRTQFYFCGGIPVDGPRA